MPSQRQRFKPQMRKHRHSFQFIVMRALKPYQRSIVDDIYRENIILKHLRRH